ncbi:MAG: hypothetical protein J6K31_08645 [Parabacteroides sp.]|nr:hypothetical protein [Parabacteroides sp.]
MIIHIANPIYDSVFKYLMEDERIAKTLLSALLKKEVLSVETRRHEYTNGQRDNISMFRIDFAARVKESDGRERLILIELQKTWLETETLRFRQYLGAQYANPENMVGEERRKTSALPMVAVYLLGHRVGDIEEPVLYVNHKSHDYAGVEVTKGLPNPFVESLTHDSIIVQIPLLRGQVNNRLDKVLSVFDQTMKDKTNNQVLLVEEDLYAGDKEMEYILHRLLAAAADSKLRQDMNVEEEYFMALEDRDTAIMNRDKIIAEKETVIAEKETVIAEKETVIAEKETVIAEKDAVITKKDAVITEQEAVIAEQETKMSTMIRKMMQQGMQEEDIMQLTGLSVEEVRRLKQ